MPPFSSVAEALALEHTRFTLFSWQRFTLPERTIEGSDGTNWFAELSMYLKLRRVGVSKYATHIIRHCCFPPLGITDELRTVTGGGGKYTRTSFRLTVTRPAVSRPWRSCADSGRDTDTTPSSTSARCAMRRNV